MEVTRRYPALGGVAAWLIPIVAIGFATTAAVTGNWTLLATIGVVALIAEVLARAVVFEVSSAGLVRGLVVGGALVGPARIIPWGSVAEVTTRWRCPPDYTALETVVLGRDGERIQFGSDMGLRAYQQLLADVVRRAPQARCTGLTDELLARR